VRERELNDDIGIEHVDGRKQPADLHAKPIAHVPFEYCAVKFELFLGSNEVTCAIALCDSVVEEVIRLKNTAN